jgi:hypothetical protein
MTRAELQKRIDEMARQYAESRDAKVKAEIDELARTSANCEGISHDTMPLAS